ncbi:MAG: cupredoxin domain-containing protein [Candidatus Rokuibacteriota bacterium]
MRYGPAGIAAWALVIAAASGAAAADVAITQKDRAFSPSDVTVSAGDTLVFVNADTVRHNVHSPTEGFVFDLDIQRPGQADRLPVRKRGAFDVLCHIHPKMKLRVRVE